MFFDYGILLHPDDMEKLIIHAVYLLENMELKPSLTRVQLLLLQSRARIERGLARRAPITEMFRYTPRLVDIAGCTVTVIDMLK